MTIGPVSVSFVLTLLVFSYLLGDNILFRMAVAAFVGLTAAFTTIVTYESVFVPFIVSVSGDIIAMRETSGFTLADISGTTWILIVSSILTVTLLLKPFAGLKTITNLALAFLVAVGSAIAVVGALTGTLIPLALDSAQADGDNLLNAILLIVGVVTTLLYFQYLARWNRLGDPERGPIGVAISSIGQVFIAIALGAIYGAAILTSLTILTGHLSTLLG